jgi:hypothetical protein
MLQRLRNPFLTIAFHICLVSSSGMGGGEVISEAVVVRHLRGPALSFSHGHAWAFGYAFKGLFISYLSMQRR